MSGQPVITVLPAPTTAPASSSTKLEDQILMLGVLLGAGATFFTNQSLTIFGLSPFLLSAITASVGKGLVGLKDPRSYEDWILVIASVFGALSGALTGKAEFAVYGLVIGQIGKAVLSFQGANKTNIIEDGLLFAFAVLTAIGQAFNIPTLVNGAMFFGAIGKALPSLGAAAPPTPSTTS